MGPELMGKFGIECNIESKYFMDNLQITESQYNKFVDGHWAVDDISPDMEQKLFALLVEGVTKVTPGGEAYNGYNGNTAAAKRARSEMKLDGFGQERLE